MLVAYQSTDARATYLDVGYVFIFLTRAVKGDFSNFTRYVFGNQEVKLESSCKIIDLLSFTASFQL